MKEIVSWLVRLKNDCFVSWIVLVWIEQICTIINHIQWGRKTWKVAKKWVDLSIKQFWYIQSFLDWVDNTVFSTLDSAGIKISVSPSVGIFVCIETVGRNWASTDPHSFLPFEVSSTLCRNWRVFVFEYYSPKWMNSSWQAMENLTLMVCQQTTKSNRNLWLVWNPFDWFRRK